MREGDKIREILAAVPPDQRLFRINSGMGWAGKVLRREPSLIVLETPRPLHAAPEGWPDICGWTTIEITPEMVGQRIAVFTGMEVKVSGNLSKAQKAFGGLLERMGGYFNVIRR